MNRPTPQPPEHADRVWHTRITEPGVLNLLGLDWAAAEVLKRTDHTAVLRLNDTPIGPIIAKIAPSRRAVREHWGPLRRQARNADKLHRRVPSILPESAIPLAGVRGVREGITLDTLFMHALPGRTLLDHLAERRADDLAPIVGRGVGRIVRAGLFNRDHKPSNLIVAPDRRSLAVIDTVAIRPTPFPARSVERMFASLIIEPTGVCGPPASEWLDTAAVAALRELHRPDRPAAPGHEEDLFEEPPSDAELEDAHQVLARVDRRIARHLLKHDPRPRH
ncbi:MAG: hypothetical protein ACF8SC_11170 [Phycisphaerales bacterium JB037]